MTDKQATRVMVFFARAVAYCTILAQLVPITIAAFATTRMRGRR